MLMEDEGESLFRPEPSAEGWRELFGGLDADVGKTVREEREAQGLSQRELAERVSEVLPQPWRQTTVAKTELGTRPLRFVEACAIARALNFESVTQLQGDDLTQSLHARRYNGFLDLMQETLRKLGRTDGHLPSGTTQVREIAEYMGSPSATAEGLAAMINDNAMLRDSMERAARETDAQVKARQKRSHREDRSDGE